MEGTIKLKIMYKENEFIRIKHSISGVNQSPIELEVPRECIDDLFGSLGVDVYDKQRDDVCKIWKELDGLEFVDDDSLWEDIGIMLGDCSVGSNGWDYRMRSLNDELYEKVDELVHKHKLEQWKYFDWDEYENNLSIVW